MLLGGSGKKFCLLLALVAGEATQELGQLQGVDPLVTPAFQVVTGRMESNQKATAPLPCMEVRRGFLGDLGCAWFAFKHDACGGDWCEGLGKQPMSSSLFTTVCFMALTCCFAGEDGPGYRKVNPQGPGQAGQQPPCSARAPAQHHQGG